MRQTTRRQPTLESLSARPRKDKSGHRSPRGGCRRRCFAPGDSRIAGRVACLRPRLLTWRPDLLRSPYRQRLFGVGKYRYIKVGGVALVSHMLDARLDLSQSSIKIPERFHQVRYDYERYPGTPGVLGLVGVQTVSNTPTNFCFRLCDT
jgi:hypothetical protein